MITPKVVTVGEVLDAIEKDGYEKVQHKWERYERVPRKIGPFKTGENWKITGACAIGQGALNLDVSPGSLYGELSKIRPAFSHFSLGSDIIHSNDNTDTPVPEIARQFREFLSPEELAIELTVYKVED